MKVLVVASVICSLVFVVNAHAGSGEINGIWKFTRDYTLNDNVSKNANTSKVHEVECSSHHNKFTCWYIGADSNNDSIFSGETNKARTTKIITFFQYDATYYVTHSGHEVAPNRFVGTWYDVTGLSGDFELTQ